ncbi:osteopetrosis-associated transmembrane protein 1 [Lates japonicus]
MSLHKNCSFLVLIVINIYAFVSSDAVNFGASDTADRLRQTPSLSPDVVNSPVVFKPVSDSSLSLMASLPEDLEINDYCSDLLLIFGQRYVAYVNCLVRAARPVMVCQNCSAGYSSLVDMYTNISSDQVGPGNVSCRDSLLHSDRLMLVFQLYNNLKNLWDSSGCKNCITAGLQSPTNDTLYFMATLHQTTSCFDKYQHGNHTELCKNCKNTYKDLNELYSRMEKNQTLCIDIEDAMNMTRKEWSKKFNCSFPP